MIDLTIPKRYFSENTMSHLRIHEGLSDRYILRSLDVTLAAKLTHVYGKYHLMMDYRKLAMSNYQMNYQQAERQAHIMNQLTFVHHSPEDIIHVEVFWNFVSICNTDRNKYIPKLKGTKKCNLRFADSGIRLSSFYIIKTR